MWSSHIFFFSSRRRHTRSLCDWSSDVCSSDLPRPHLATGVPLSGGVFSSLLHSSTHTDVRSEERRVGKECRYLRELNRENEKFDHSDVCLLYRESAGQDFLLKPMTNLPR